MKRKIILTILVLSVVFGLGACRRKTPSEDPIDIHDLTVREAFGNNGMVSTASSYASEIGLNVLKSGGNAFDAAIAIAFALNVSEPNASGIGGGGFMVGYDAENDERLAYHFREFAPAAATLDAFGSRNELADGAKSIGVPMLVDGMKTIHENHGTKSWAELLQPAANLAREGIIVTPLLADTIAQYMNKILRQRDENMEVYLPNGVFTIDAGETLINENLAKTLDILIAEGPEAFYNGPIAEAIINTIQAQEGLMTMSDLQMGLGATEFMTPVSGMFEGYEIMSMPPPSSGGITINQIFNMLAAHGDIADLGFNTAEYLHVLATAQQLGFGDRERYIGDPDFVDVPVEGLMSPSYAASRWELFNPNQAILFSGDDLYGNPWAYQDIQPVVMNAQENISAYESGSTSHFSVIDRDGNIASVTLTINYFFGAGVTAEGTGIHLNNQLADLNLDSESVNVVAPFKTPLSSMSPTVVLKDGEPFMAIGSPGATRIITSVAQVILNVIVFDMDIQTAVEQPRNYQFIDSPMRIEATVGVSVIDALKLLGYEIIEYAGDASYFGSVQAITINSDTGQLHGGADRRRDAKALGY